MLIVPKSTAKEINEFVEVRLSTCSSIGNLDVVSWSDQLCWQVYHACRIANGKLSETDLVRQREQRMDHGVL